MLPRPAARRVIASTIAAALALALVGCAAQPRGVQEFYKRAVAPTPNSAPPSHPLVTAFIPSWADQDDQDASKAAIDMVAIQGIDIAAGGAAVTAPAADVLGQLAHAHQLGKKAEVLLVNEGPDGFSDDVAKAMLDTKANRDAAAKSLAGIVKQYGFDGVMFDLEELSPADADGLTAFAAALRTEVGPSIHLDAAIQPSTNLAGYAKHGYDLAGLLKSLDNITVMAYDQHGTFNPADPGPIGELSWQKKVLAAVLLTAQPGQVDLGVAGYGYRWASDGVHTVGDVRARRLVAEAKATPTFDAVRGEWTATLPDGEVFWWSDAKSIAMREQLAASWGLRGIAVWSLAVSDALPVAP
ncbi:MAG TPA: glycosyl hydrolase family 18 protein [Pseudolysinimonas sp.]|jgi:spore germination protein YaaH